MTGLLIFLGATIFSPSPVPADSLRSERVDGKTFVIHRVEQGETLYSLSRRYGSTITQILEYNKEADAGLEIGQILRIPYSAPVQTTTVSEGEQHTVAAGETLFSLSRQYNVSVDDLRNWNHLTDNSLSIGQQLIVHPPQKMMTLPTQSSSVAAVHTVAPGETLYGISKQYDISVSDLMDWNHLTGTSLNVGQTLYLRHPDYQQSQSDSSLPNQSQVNNDATRVVDSAKVNTNEPLSENNTSPAFPVMRDIKVSEAVRGSEEVVESGQAELIEGTEGNRKYLALHRSVPVGTILKIRNEMNNREVFVRVVGKLPDTAQNNGLLIKISRSAYDRLGAINPRFRVEITYYK